MRRLLLAFLLIVCIAAGVFLYLHFAATPVFDSFKPGMLDDYLPRDAAAVVSFDLKQLRDQGAFENPLGRKLRETLDQEDFGLPFALLGSEVLADVDALRLAFSAGDHGRPLVLLQGRFDRARFKTGRGQLEELIQDGFRLYRYRDEGGAITLALAGDTLVVCYVRSRVLDALRHAAGKTTTRLEDVRLSKLLEKVDRSNALWFAADLDKLGKPPQLLFEAQLRPVFEESTMLSGGVSWGDDLRSDVAFVTRAEENSRRLETHLQRVVKVASALAPFVREEYEKLFMRLFANAEIMRKGTDVTLHARLLNR